MAATYADARVRRGQGWVAADHARGPTAYERRRGRPRQADGSPPRRGCRRRGGQRSAPLARLDRYAWSASSSRRTVRAMVPPNVLDGYAELSPTATENVVFIRSRDGAPADVADAVAAASYSPPGALVTPTSMHALRQTHGGTARARPCARRVVDRGVCVSHCHIVFRPFTPISPCCGLWAAIAARFTRSSTGRRCGRRCWSYWSGCRRPHRDSCWSSNSSPTRSASFPVSPDRCCWC